MSESPSMAGVPAEDPKLSAWHRWLDTPAGRYLLAWEQAQLDAAVADVFGYHALQCGLPGLDALRANRMPNRMVAWLPVEQGMRPPAPQQSTPPADAASEAGMPPAGAARDTAPGAVIQLTRDARPVQPVLVEAWEDLPFGAQSLDLVVLSHVLEFSSDPHQVLREVDRVLRPEGRVIITGLNPVSLWGARHAMGAVLPGFLPRGTHLLGIPRLRDWTKLLGFELDRGRYGCYAPPCGTVRWLERLQWMEKAGDRWWPICGAAYLLAAVKRVRGMRLVGPAWKRAPARGTAVATSAPVRRSERRVIPLPGPDGR